MGAGIGVYLAKDGVLRWELALACIWLGTECRDGWLALVCVWLGTVCRDGWLALVSVWLEIECRDGRLAIFCVWLGKGVPRWVAGIGVLG